MNDPAKALRLVSDALERVRRLQRTKEHGPHTVLGAALADVQADLEGAVVALLRPCPGQRPAAAPAGGGA